MQQAEGPDSMLENILAELPDNYEVFRGMAATDDELDRLQRRAVSEEDISRLGQGCIICISGFVIGEIITTLPCYHVFHADCLMTWLMINGVCLLCSRLCRPWTPIQQHSSYDSSSLHDHNSIYVESLMND